MKDCRNHQEAASKPESSLSGIMESGRVVLLERACGSQNTEGFGQEVLHGYQP